MFEITVTNMVVTGAGTVGLSGRLSAQLASGHTIYSLVILTCLYLLTNMTMSMCEVMERTR